MRPTTMTRSGCVQPRLEKRETQQVPTAHSREKYSNASTAPRGTEAALVTPSSTGSVAAVSLPHRNTIAHHGLKVSFRCRASPDRSKTGEGETGIDTLPTSRKLRPQGGFSQISVAFQGMPSAAGRSRISTAATDGGGTLR